jgi:hypothetical protein
MRALIVVSAALFLSACGGGGKEVVFDTVLGPETKNQIEPLPATLQGDSENARYSAENLKGKNLESTDGTER